jgi:uncharacterized cupin superfamily protein
MGESGEHQFHNHTDADCTYLNLRTAMGIDVCEYPDSGKSTSFHLPIFSSKMCRPIIFEGEQQVDEKWNLN